MLDYRWDAVAGDSNQEEGEAEQDHEGEFAFHGHVRHEHDWHRESD